jgi:hypothetical protein
VTFRSIPYDVAVGLLQQPTHVLVKTFTNTKRGREFLIVGENGGPISEAVAVRLLAHPECHSVDPGLLPGAGQSFSLCCWEKTETRQWR